MAIAIALLVLVVGSVLFHLLTPWWITPLASNWKQMDDTLTITVVVTGIFFVVINLFVVYTLWRFRHRDGVRAAYQPENRRLERWLIGVTSVGIAALLAPGLAVYARYLDPDPDALVVEVLGQQWQWRYRLPGDDGKLGRTDVRFMSGENPFGIDPSDAAGQDDRLVNGNEVKLPLGRPVKMLLRSRDTLHDFFAPQFRARMNIVPGQVAWFWFTPTKTGRFEAMCAQLCGVGHSAMRGFVVVEDAAAFTAWQQALPTFAALRAPAAAGGSPAERGRGLAQAKGCVACHTVDGSRGVGPTWKGVYGKTETLEGGATAKVDEKFLREFIRDPAARPVAGFPAVMPRIELADDELDAVVAYIRSLGTEPAR